MPDAHGQPSLTDLTQLALKWVNRRTDLSMQLNSNLIRSTDNNREQVFQTDFIAAHNEITRELISLLGISDVTLMSALAELISNAPRMLQPGTGGPN